MSNLKLPSLAYNKLDKFLPPLKEGQKWGNLKKLGYQTWAYRDGADTIVIRHHDTEIATLTLWTVAIHPRGYNSSTTTARLHRVMVDNGLWGRFTTLNAFGVAIRQGQTSIITPDDNKGEPIPYAGAEFAMVAGQWERV